MLIVITFASFSSGTLLATKALMSSFLKMLLGLFPLPKKNQVCHHCLKALVGYKKLKNILHTSLQWWVSLVFPGISAISGDSFFSLPMLNLFVVNIYLTTHALQKKKVPGNSRRFPESPAMGACLRDNLIIAKGESKDAERASRFNISHLVYYTVQYLNG
jgi:hypothetical protein